MPKSRLRSIALVALLVTFAAACLPAAPSAGRGGPVRKVAIIGDSLTWGLFGTSPTAEAPLRSKINAGGALVTLDGGPGDTLATPWPGHTSWAQQLQTRINTFDPDVVIIQSVLFPGADNPANWNGYRAAASQLLDIAQSRGAHVYFVSHHRPTNATEFRAAQIAEQLQTEAAANRGVSKIPLNWWLDRCQRPFLGDGWHLSGNGVECLANAMNAAVNQLRNDVG